MRTDDLSIFPNTEEVALFSEDMARQGIPEPVMVGFGFDAPQARAAYLHLTGEPLTRGLAPQAQWHLAGFSNERLQGALRAHCGVGGAAVAALLADRTPPRAGCWWVGLTRAGMTWAAYVGGKLSLYGAQVYDRVARGAQTLAEVLNDSGPARCNVTLADGTVLTLYGRSGPDIARSMDLIAAIDSKRVAVEHRGRLRAVRLDDEGLSGVLRRRYGGACGPHQVAEAVRALKQANKHRWLLGVLWGRPELRELARRVQEELTGEPG
jgi:hypothetical protein